MDPIRRHIERLVNPSNSADLYVWIIESYSTRNNTKWAFAPPLLFNITAPWLFVVSVDTKTHHREQWGYAYLPLVLSQNGVRRLQCLDDLPLPLRLQDNETWTCEDVSLFDHSSHTLPHALSICRVAYEHLMVYLGKDDLKEGLCQRIGPFFQLGHQLSSWHNEVRALLSVMPVIFFHQYPALHLISPIALQRLVMHRAIACETALFRERLVTCWSHEFYEIAQCLRRLLCTDYEPLTTLPESLSSVDNASLRSSLLFTMPFEMATAALRLRTVVLWQGHALMTFAALLKCMPEWYGCWLKQAWLKERTRLSTTVHPLLQDERFRGFFHRIRKTFESWQSGDNAQGKSINEASLIAFKHRAPPCAMRMIEAYRRDTQRPLARKTHGATVLNWENRLLTLNVLVHCGLAHSDIYALTDTRIEQVFSLDSDRRREKQEVRSLLRTAPKTQCMGCVKVGQAGWCPYVVTGDIENIPQRQCALAISMKDVVRTPQAYVEHKTKALP